MDARNRELLSNMAREAKNSTATLDVLATQPLVRLRYSIAEASSFSGAYEPHNILYDRPHELASRWSGAAVASIAPHATPSSTSSGSGGGPSSSAQRSSSPLSGTRDVGPAASVSSSATVPIGRGVNSRASATPHAHLAGDKQYIILKLEKPSILRKIHFGKFHKPHPCNLKDFKVYASQATKDPQSHVWVRILRGGLRNDPQAEAFDVRWTNSEGVPFPVHFVKLVPLATHSPNYNFSVWHIALEGISDRYCVQRVTDDYQEHRESTAMRLILKHLRSRAYHSAFRTLLQSSKLGSTADTSDLATKVSARRPFEDVLVTQLFNSLMQGAWDAAEECLERAAWGDLPHGVASSEAEEAVGTRDSVFSEEDCSINSAASLFASYVNRSMPKARWTQIFATDSDGDAPCGRGGHEMELDSEKGIIWLFGGWDGTKDLADLWAYYIEEGRWRCVSRDVRYQGGPGPRSCHKMVFDPRTGFLYVLGKFIDFDKGPVAGSSVRSATNSPNMAQRGSSPLASPAPNLPATASSNRSATRGFFLPRVAGTAEGGSQPSGSHTAERSTDYGEELFGSARGGSTRLSSGRTSFLSVDRANRVAADGGASGANSPSASSPIPSGQSSHSGYESDFYRFSTRTERWDRLSFDTHSESGPKLIFDHQMVIDPDTQLLYVFGGRVAHPDSSKVELSGMWKYDVIQRSWTFLFDDLTHAQSRIPSRVGHTMLMDTHKKGSMAGKKLIWVLAGQRNSQYLADMWTYHPSTGVVREISKDYSASFGPEGGFTQRAAVDSVARELYLFSGLVKKSKNKGEKVKSAFWIYSMERGDWRMVYQYGGLGSFIKGEGEAEGEEGDNGDEDTSMDVAEPESRYVHAFPSTSDAGLGLGLAAGEGRVGRTGTGGWAAGTTGSSLQQGGEVNGEPQPRYAAQLMYDSKRKSFYIFGGNPADSHQSSLRLDDLWSLELVRPGLSEVLRKAKFKLRQQRFLELSHDQQRSGGDGSCADLPGGVGAGWGAMQALVYLQTQVSQVVNHDIAEESQAFRKLMAHLLSASSGGGGGRDMSSPLVSSSDVSFPAFPATSLAYGALETTCTGATLIPTAEQADREETITRSAVTSESGGTPTEEEEMLSISQVLPKAATSAAKATGTDYSVPNLLDSSNLGAEGRASQLYKQRYQLFKALLDFFPPESVEPDIDLLDCIELSKLSF